MAAAIERRNYTLDRMADEGFITTAEADAAKARADRDARPADAAAVDRAVLPRDHSHAARGAVRRQGASTKTVWSSRPASIPALQRAANRALDDGLRRLDKLRGYRKPTRNVLAEKRALETYRHPRWTREPAAGDIIPAS